jgi:hypothetical protein
MFERFKRRSLTATVAALVAALGVGGVAVAQSSGSGSQPATGSPPRASAPAQKVAGQESNAPENSATDRDNVQAGDQTAPDPAGGGSENESATGQESGSELPGDDGPGGHADEPGNPNADRQATGAE